ncbi:hypothetical protein [Vibrio owensii]|uniref:hypothetical protein n=1 Tax=Vibrio owensii TaxID=696485 RepID=UPI003CC5487C
MGTETLLIKLDRLLSECKSDKVMELLQEHKAELNEDMLEAIFRKYGIMIQYFKFKLNTESNMQLFEKFLVAALTPGVKTEGDSYAELYFKTHHLDKQYCKDFSEAFTRNVYLTVKPSLFSNPEHLHAYLETFIPVLTEEDIFELHHHAESLDYSMKRAVIRICLESGKTPQALLRDNVELLGFPYLSDEFRNQYALLGVSISAYNFKHISHYNREKTKHLINLYETPMLVEYHPDRERLTFKQWLELVKLDKRCLRFVPKRYVVDDALFSDDMLIELLVGNQKRYGPRYKLLTFIYEKAPDRITLAFVKRIREMKLLEANHQIVANI